MAVESATSIPMPGPISRAREFLTSRRIALVGFSCLDAGLRRIWFHRGGGPGSASPEAIALCIARGVTPVSDICPFMVISGASWPHRLHGWVRRRKLPKEP
jgi:hypothetical protein